MNAADPANRSLKIIYLSLGSNIEPETNIPRAISLLKEYGEITAISSVWRSAPIGSQGPEFLNAAVLFLSSLNPLELKPNVLRQIEASMGRVRVLDKNAPRPIDIDILIYEDQELDDSIWERAHIAIPLADIYPEYRHPITNELITEAAKRLNASNLITLETALSLE